MEHFINRIDKFVMTLNIRWNKFKPSQVKSTRKDVFCQETKTQSNNFIKTKNIPKKPKYEEDKFNKYKPILEDLEDFLLSLSSIKFDKCLPILIETIIEFKKVVLRKELKLTKPIKDSKWGREVQRTNKPRGRTRGKRGFMQFNKTKYDVSKLNLKTKPFKKVKSNGFKDKIKKVFGKRKAVDSLVVTISDSLKTKDDLTNKCDNTSKDLDNIENFDFDISGALKESNERRAEEKLDNILASKIYIHRIYPSTEFLILTDRDVQRQEGLNDCGLFVLAYMFTLCSDKDPSCCSYKQDAMRSHYNNCVKKKKFDTPFPHIELKRRHINDTKYVYECNKGIWQS
jgi:hypothetical protein